MFLILPLGLLSFFIAKKLIMLLLNFRYIYFFRLVFFFSNPFIFYGLSGLFINRKTNFLSISRGKNPQSSKMKPIKITTFFSRVQLPFSLILFLTETIELFNDFFSFRLFFSLQFSSAKTI